MNRRELSVGALFGAFGLGAAGAALAQPGMDRAMGDAERRHVMDTARVGTLSLKTSQLAEPRVRGKVNEFANFEIDEQKTIAQILQEVSRMPPPPLPPEEQAKLDRLDGMHGVGFSRSYIALQTDGHQKLLQIQERYLSEGAVPAMRHVAMLARGQIKEHLRLLSDLRTSA